MKRFGLVVLGAALTLVAMGLAAWLFGQLAIYSPFSWVLWKFQGPLVIYGSEFISIVPIALVLSVILWRLFSSRRVLNAFFSVSIALLVGLAGALDDPNALQGFLKEMPQFWMTYLLGVPAVVSLLERLRSNKLKERRP